MLKIEMLELESDFSKFRANFTCPNCNSIVWFFSKEDAPNECPYCYYDFIRLFGLVNGYRFARHSYYRYGDT